MRLTGCISLMALTAVLSFIQISCTDNEEETETYQVEAVTLDITQVELIPGETITLKPTLQPFGKTVDEAITWDSSIKDLIFWRTDNPKVAEVDENGVVTAKGAGTCNVSFICGSLAASCKVTVRYFDNGILYGLWEMGTGDGSYFFDFDGSGHSEQGEYEWTFDGMRLNVSGRGFEKTLILTSISMGRISFYYSDDTERESFSLKRAPVELTPDELEDCLIELQAGNDSTVTVVDLGLPSGLLWASCNLGASVPEEDGNRYAWAEITLKQSYSLENYQWYDTKTCDLTKYADGSQSSLLADDDPVQACLGGQWHTPSDVDVMELFTYCNVLYSSVSGREGFLFISKNSNKSNSRLFVPFVLSSNLIGNVDPDSDSPYSKYGFYWTSAISAANSYEACTFCISIEANDVYLSLDLSKARRYYGLCIRPVTTNQ